MSETPAQPAADGDPGAPAARAGKPPRREYAGEPTRAQVRRRPVWLLSLLACLAVAGVFAWLGQWQMEHAIQEDTNALVDSEEARPLDSLAVPGDAVSEAVAGMAVSLQGSFEPDDLLVVEQRMNDSELGAWVVGNMTVGADDPDAQLAVALGWAPTTDAAYEALDNLQADAGLAEAVTVVGRFMPAEAPQIPDETEDPYRILSMVPAQLANLWTEVGAPVYSGFLVLHPEDSGTSAPLVADIAAAQLDAIDSVAPLPPERINWLNLFYAIEWAIFGGFAIYFWFRLTRDAWEREHELKALREAQGDGDPNLTGDTTSDTPAQQ